MVVSRRIRLLLAAALMALLLSCGALGATGAATATRRGVSARLPRDQRLDLLWAPCAPDHPARVALFHTDTSRQNRFVNERLYVLVLLPVWPACP